MAPDYSVGYHLRLCEVLSDERERWLGKDCHANQDGHADRYDHRARVVSESPSRSGVHPEG